MRTPSRSGRAVCARPSQRLHKLVATLGGPFRASQVWSIHHRTARRLFVDGRGASGDTLATILYRTGLTFEEAFDIVPNRP